MTVRSRQFSGTNVLGTTPTNLYVVPPGRTALIKWCYVTNTLAGAHTLTVRINAVPFAKLTVPGAGSAVMPAPFVGQPDDSIDAFWDLLTGSGVVSLFGSLLLGAPS